MEVAEKEALEVEKMPSGDRAVCFNGVRDDLQTVTCKLLNCNDIHLE